MFSFAKNTMITVSVAASTPLLDDLFHLPLSMEAYDQFLSFSNLIQGLQLQNSPDIWTYIWGTSAFASNKAYRMLIGYRQVPSHLSNGFGVQHVKISTKSSSGYY